LGQGDKSVVGCDQVDKMGPAGDRVTKGWSDVTKSTKLNQLVPGPGDKIVIAYCQVDKIGQAGARLT
jgi:hypothetical protein